MIGRALQAGQTLSEAAIARLPSADVSQARVISRTSIRPWPLPEEPWLMAQTWRDLLFAHWSLPPEALERVLPSALPLATFEGRAWIGVTPFEISGLRPRGALPVPGVSRFCELNVRTYIARASASPPTATRPRSRPNTGRRRCPPAPFGDRSSIS